MPAATPGGPAGDAAGRTCTWRPRPIYETGGAARVPLLVAPEAGERRRAIAVGPAHGESAHVAEVRLPDQEPAIVRHPHPEHLVELAVEDLLGEHLLLGAIGRLAE